MKKIFTLFITFIILLTLSSCNKENISSENMQIDNTINSDINDKEVDTDVEESTLDSSENEVDVSLVESEIVPSHSHSYISTVISPTCTKQGYTQYSCSCGDTYNENYTSAKGHIEVIDKAVDATISATGLTEGKHCSVCGAILLAQKVIPKLASVTYVEKGNSSFKLINDLNEEYTCGPVSNGPNKCKIENFVCSIGSFGNGQIMLNINFDMRKTAQGSTPSKDIKVFFNLYRDGEQIDGAIILQGNADVGCSYKQTITKYFIPEGNYTMEIASCNQ